MAQFRTAFTCLFGVGSILGLMGLLAFGAFSVQPDYQAALCSEPIRCEIAPLLTAQEDVDKAPTLAPPRTQEPSIAESTSGVISGQPVYVQVTADHSGIEVGWAPGEMMGR